MNPIIPCPNPPYKTSRHPAAAKIVAVAQINAASALMAKRCSPLRLGITVAPCVASSHGEPGIRTASFAAMNIPTLKIPPVVTVLLLGSAMWAIARAFPDWRMVLPAEKIIAAGLALTGVVIAIAGVASFRRVKTTVNPLQPSAASTLVIVGIYRFTRNPMYLGLWLVLLGWAVFLGNALALIFPVVYIPLMNRLQIIPEEKALAAKFGSQFTKYQSQVRRWL